MQFKTINLKSATAEGILKMNASGQLSPATKEEFKALIACLSNACQSADFNLATNSFLIATLVDPAKAFDEVQKKGIFRYSKYFNSKCIINKVAISMLEIDAVRSMLSETQLAYLKSIVDLVKLHLLYRNLHRDINNRITRFNKKYPEYSLVKTLVSFLDITFLINNRPQSIKDQWDLSNRQPEDIAEAISYLVYLISERETLKRKKLLFVAEDFVLRKEIDRIVATACFCNDLREIEVMVEHFGYTCAPLPNGLHIVPPSEDFERDMRLGFIRDQLQFQYDTNLDHEIPSLEDLANKLNENKSLNLFKLNTKNGYSRYSVEIPEPVFQTLADKVLKSDEFYREEAAYLERIFKEQMIDMTTLESVKIKDSLTILDFFKIKRWFYLLYLLFAKQIFEKENRLSRLLYRSIVPVIDLDILYEWLERLTSTEKIDTFLDIVCWEPGMEGVLDLQYQSLIFVDNFIFLPLTVFAESNTIRNMYASEQKKNNKNLLLDGRHDPIAKSLGLAFDKHGIVNRGGIEYNNGEIDFWL